MLLLTTCTATNKTCPSEVMHLQLSGRSCLRISLIFHDHAKPPGPHLCGGGILLESLHMSREARPQERPTDRRLGGGEGKPIAHFLPPQKNKNRLCSMTCGIYKTYKIDRLDTKRSFVGAAEGAKHHLNEKKRSHPEEKLGPEATDIDQSQRIPPRRKFWVGNKDGYWTSKKVDLDLW